MAPGTVSLVILNPTGASRVSPSLGRQARRAGWRLRSVRRCSDGRSARLWDVRAPGPVVVIGGDVASPAARDALAAAVAALACQDLVLGPCASEAEDGGVWLIGLARRRRVPAGLLAGAGRRSADVIAAILARVPMQLWQAELLALEDFPRLKLR